MVSGCTSPAPYINPSLGFEDGRRVVIVGDKVSGDVAYYYQRKYDALVWFTPSEGMMVDSAHRMLQSVGPSRSMKVLINELKSINYTIGRWEIIIPKTGEHFFLETLSHMETKSLSKARGMIVLIDSSGNKDMEAQVKRVTDGNFFVTYEFQKDLGQIK